MRVWINFKELRAKLKFEDVLRHYKVDVRRKGEQHQGSCPLPNHSGRRDSPSFSANLERGIFHCFGCGAKGNLLEFAALMSGVDAKNGSALRKVAVELQTRFCPEGASTRTRESTTANSSAVVPKHLQVLVNAPLDFMLKDLDAEHPYLLERGFSKETIAHFGLGYCSRGMLKDRVAIPLYDHVGKLVGYSGRVVNDSTANEDNPRYCFPTARERNGVRYDFDQSLLLYNSHRIEAPCADLAVVQGFPSVWWLHQCGFHTVVGLTADDPSERQIELILSLIGSTGRIWIMPDGDKAGDLVAQYLLRRLSPHHFVRWVKLDGEDRPTDLSVEKLKKRLAS